VTRPQEHNVLDAIHSIVSDKKDPPAVSGLESRPGSSPFR
jgi:hypothetical protein